MKTVYFIKAIGMRGPIKIGCSFSPTGRMKSLQAWSPLALEIIAQISGDFHIERRFHQRFLSQHKAHEWFHWSQDLQDTIDAICAGTFDLAALPEANGSPLEKGKPHTKTPLGRKRQSYTVRAFHTLKRTGFGTPIRLYKTPEDGEVIDRYLAAPHLYGEPINAPWAAEKRAEYLASLELAA